SRLYLVEGAQIWISSRFFFEDRLRMIGGIVVNNENFVALPTDSLTLNPVNRGGEHIGTIKRRNNNTYSVHFLPLRKRFTRIGTFRSDVSRYDRAPIPCHLGARGKYIECGPPKQLRIKSYCARNKSQIAAVCEGNSTARHAPPSSQSGSKEIRSF